MDIAFPKDNENDFKGDFIFIYPKKCFKSNQKYGFISDKKIKPFSVYKGSNRKVFENGVDLIYGLEFSNERDFIFHRNSGMNHVLAKIAKEKNVTIGFSFSDWKKSKNKATILGRMHQNYVLCQKYKVKTLVASFASEPSDVADKTQLNAFENLLKKKKLY